MKSNRKSIKTASPLKSSLAWFGVNMLVLSLVLMIACWEESLVVMRTAELSFLDQCFGCFHYFFLWVLPYWWMLLLLVSVFIGSLRFVWLRIFKLPQ